MRVANLAPLLYNGKAKAIGGRLAQRLERLVHTEEAGGSNPPSPTIEGNLMLPLPPALGRPPGRGGETADALRSGRSVLYGRVGSNPSLGTSPFRKETGHGSILARPADFRSKGNYPGLSALVAQWRERCPAEAEVVGSNPAKRAISLPTDSRFPLGQPGRPASAGKGLAVPYCGWLAQLVRAPALHAGSHWFESSTAHHFAP